MFRLFATIMFIIFYIASTFLIWCTLILFGLTLPITLVAVVNFIAQFIWAVSSNKKVRRD